MAKQKQHKSSDSGLPKIQNICQNRHARHEYEIHDTLECGLMLVGTEVKSLREGRAVLEDAFARVDDGELWLYGCEIPEYTFGNRMNHSPKRARKLLAHRREIAKFAGKASDRGFTLIPLRMYFKDGKAKIELALARGKQQHDKREAVKKADAKREMDRAASARRKK